LQTDAFATTSHQKTKSLVRPIEFSEGHEEVKSLKIVKFAVARSLSLSFGAVMASTGILKGNKK
jgi:hypothetical protein